MLADYLLIYGVSGAVGIAAGAVVVFYWGWKDRRARRRLFRPSANPPKVYENRPATDKERYGVRKTRAKVGHGRRHYVPPKVF